MRTPTYRDLIPEIDRARRRAREEGGDELGRAVGWLFEAHPACTSSNLLHWVVQHRQECPAP